MLEMVGKIGPSDANILITGEHGTGKDVVARSLHAVSGRAHKPLIVVNVGGLAEGVFASELFGHVKGAYTDARSDRIGRFEMADGGTLFLDEIANVPLAEQAKLLRVLETGEVERVASLESRVPVTVCGGPECVLEADADQLDQLLINLVRNAADAVSADGGRVELEWTVEGDTLELLVRDTGPGLPHSANLFVPFFTTKPGGSGIGLVLCRQVAEGHGGTVSLSDRKDGPGCVASVRLPIRHGGP